MIRCHISQYITIRFSVPIPTPSQYRQGVPNLWRYRYIISKNSPKSPENINLVSVVSRCMHLCIYVVFEMQQLFLIFLHVNCNTNINELYYQKYLTSSTWPGFKLMTSRSWQYISCWWDTCPNHLTISDCKRNVLLYYLRGLRWFLTHGLSDRLMHWHGLNRSITHPKFNPTMIPTHDLQIMTMHFMSLRHRL